MSTLKPFRLSNGTEIPAIAFGSGTAWYKGKNDGDINRDLVELTKKAIQAGFTHIDAAEVYGTESEIGVAIAESGAPRSSLYVTTKLLPNIKDPVAALKASLDRLKLSYVDLYLIHSPFFSESSHGISLENAWKSLETLVDQGLVKSIGVSNFRVEDLERLLKIAKIKPVINQIEYNPYLQSPDLYTFAKQHNIVLVAYSPLAPLTQQAAKGGPLEPVVNDVAARHGKTPGQVLLRWVYQKGVVIVTTSHKEERLKEFLDVGTFELSADEVKRIDEAGSKFHLRVYWKKEFEK